MDVSQVPLTAEQRRVVDCPHGPGTVTVQAVAGSGKTHVLIERARALGGRGVKPEQILFVTFTSAAKDTLRARLNKARLNRCRALTIHGLLSSVLPREHFAYDHDEVERLVLATYRAFPCGYRKFERFARALGTAWMHFQLTGPEMRVEHPVLGSALCRFGALREAFEDHFGRMLMGHDDLLIWGHRTLESGDTSIHDRLTSYQVMIADEYQDVSPLQSAIIETLAQGKHLMVVADPAQSIFGFQGSTGESFLRLARESPPLLLSDNFRCPGTHLLAASAQLQDTQRLVPAKGFCGDLQVEWSGTHEDLFARLAVRIAALSQAGEEITILVRLTEVEKEVVTFLRRRGYQVVNLKTPSEQLFKNPACRDILRPTLEVLKRRRAAEHPLKKTLNFLGHQLTADERRWLDGTWSSRRTPGEARPSTGALSPELELALRLWSDLYGFTGDSRALLSLLRPYLAPVDRGQWELLESLLDREMSLLDLETALQTAEQPSAQKIHVRTIHNAKGREFPCVVLFELPQEKKAQGAGGRGESPPRQQ